MANNKDLLFQVALTMIPQIGPVQAKLLLQHCNVEEVFHAKRSFLERIEGIGPVRAACVSSFRDFDLAEKEIRFIEKNNVRPLFITDENYPKRLLTCYDSPTLLYLKGETDLNAPKIISVIGTRHNSDYGRMITEKLLKELSGNGIVVISGLAFGIDAIAHKAALKNNLSTIAVLAHGLDQVYPYEHRHMAAEMVRNGGGLLSEFRSFTKPDRHNFPSRNRIVAGMADAVVVVETGAKGGSMITVDLANGYNKDVFAIPGRATDPKSIGCHDLIRTNKAQLITSGDDLLEIMQWKNPEKPQPKKVQRELFIELTAEEKIIIGILKEKNAVHIDEINSRSGLSSSTIAGAVLNLEMQGVVRSKPGKFYVLE